MSLRRVAAGHSEVEEGVRIIPIGGMERGSGPADPVVGVGLPLVSRPYPRGPRSTSPVGGAPRAPCCALDPDCRSQTDEAESIPRRATTGARRAARSGPGTRRSPCYPCRTVPRQVRHLMHLLRGPTKSLEHDTRLEAYIQHVVSDIYEALTAGCGTWSSRRLRDFSADEL